MLLKGFSGYLQTEYSDKINITIKKCGNSKNCIKLAICWSWCQCGREFQIHFKNVSVKESTSSNNVHGKSCVLR